ncbi:MAG: carboxylating nicotinate-nucleotide diphosphorylase [Roseiarcus sp.]
MNAARLPTILIEPIVRAALLEDLGRAGDITSDAIAPGDLMTRTAMVARQDGVVAGLDVAALAFRLINPAIVFTEQRPDGARVAPGETVARVEGPARGVLTAERVALNFLSRLSGVASATASLVAAVAGTRARIVCTRKTTPLLRGLEKYAVRAGGGANHRFGLDDAALIKDNHVAIAGGVAEAIARVRAHVGHLVKIEVEVDTLAQLDEALRVGVDAVLLDNMSLEDLRRAVTMIAGRAISEASGRVTQESAPAIAATGVDLISVGWLTHSAPILDIGLDYRG